MPGKKSGKFDNEGIEGLAKDKPVVYQIEDDKRNLLYVGVAKRGRVEARLKEHMTDGVDPVLDGAVGFDSLLDEAVQLLLGSSADEGAYGTSGLTSRCAPQ